MEGHEEPLLHGAEETLRRSSASVFIEIEERHIHEQSVIVVNSLTVFEFTDDAKIRSIRVYLQQAR